MNLSNIVSLKSFKLCALLIALSVCNIWSIKILDDNKKIIIVTHDSINYLGELRHWLDMYYKLQGKKNPIIFIDLSGRFSGMDTKDGKIVAGWVTQFKDVIKNAKGAAGGDVPVIVFCQSGMGVADILDTTDTKLIDGMNQEIKDMCDIIKGYGADLVYPSTLHYQWTHRQYAENEAVAVRAFNKKNYGYRAIDVVTPTAAIFPSGESGDKRHNNPEGRYVCTFEWMKEIFRNDGLSTPAWMNDSLASIRKKWSNLGQVVRYTGPVEGRYKVGDKIKVTWEGDCSKLDWELPVRLWVSARNMDTLPHTEYDSFYGNALHFSTVPACALGEYTWTVGEDWLKKATGGAAYGSYAVAIEVSVTARHFHGNHDYTAMGSNPTTTGHMGATFNPNNVILIYPSTTKIDLTLPIWGFWGKNKPTISLNKSENSITMQAKKKTISFSNEWNLILGVESPYWGHSLDMRGREIQKISTTNE